MEGLLAAIVARAGERSQVQCEVEVTPCGRRRLKVMVTLDLGGSGEFNSPHTMDEGGGRGRDTAGSSPVAEQQTRMTLDEEIVLWARDLAANGKGSRTRQNYESVIREVAAPQLSKTGEVIRRRWDCSAEFTREGIVEYLTSMRLDKGRAGKTVNNHRTAICSFLTRFRPKCAHWFDGPERIRPVKIKRGRGDKRALMWRELQALIKNAGDYRDLYIGGFGTALRRGALCDSERDGRCLRVEMLDLGKRPFVHVPPHLDKMGLERFLPLAPWVAEFLREIIRDQKLGPKDPVFRSAKTGRPLTGHPGTIRDDFDRAGIEARTKLGLASFHCLRYTYNTVLAILGVEETVRATLMSHTSDTMTDGVYLTPEFLPLEEAVKLLPDPRLPGIPACLRNTRLGGLTDPGMGCYSDGAMPNRLNHHHADHARNSDTSAAVDSMGIASSRGRVALLRSKAIQDAPVSFGRESGEAPRNQWAIQDSNSYRHPDGGGPNNRQDSPPNPADESDLQDEAAFGRAFEAWRRARRETGGGR